MKLSPMQKNFCDQYLVDLNASAAYKRAGYKAKGNSAEVNAHQLLKKPAVQDYIAKRMKDREKRTEITQDRVLQELAKIGFADIKGYVTFKTAQTVVGHTEDGQPIIDYAHVIDLKDSEEVDGSPISEVSLKDGTLKFKLHDKVAALEKIGRHLGMFKDGPSAIVNINNPYSGLTTDDLKKLIRDG